MFRKIFNKAIIFVIIAYFIYIDWVDKNEFIGSIKNVME